MFGITLNVFLALAKYRKIETCTSGNSKMLSAVRAEVNEAPRVHRITHEIEESLDI